MSLSELITGKQGLERALKSRDRAIVLFYASWCPFSRSFLPVFERSAKERPGRFFRVLVDDQPELCADYRVEVYPTVIFFKNEEVVLRLDGLAGFGLDEKGLSKFIADCDLEP